jgi:predicted restriction endonuclease
MENILCLCPNHHAACDLGAMRLVAAELRKVAGHVIGQEHLDYHNQMICPGNCAYRNDAFT